MLLNSSKNCWEWVGFLHYPAGALHHYIFTISHLWLTSPPKSENDAINNQDKLNSLIWWLLFSRIWQGHNWKMIIKLPVAEAAQTFCIMSLALLWQKPTQYLPWRQDIITRCQMIQISGHIHSTLPCFVWLLQQKIGWVTILYLRVYSTIRHIISKIEGMQYNWGTYQYTQECAVKSRHII